MENERKKLGFGLMRLPKKGLFTDIKEMSEMVDLFLENGFTYFDTAFIYLGSEEAARKALVSRYPRDSYTLATKVNVLAALSEGGAKKQFETSLERTGAGYFDYYLLHAIMSSNVKRYEKFHMWDYVKDLKASGKIRNFGFSFHDSPQLLEELLSAHPEVDFVQLQINYADWENPAVQSRANYEVARKHGKQIVIMEPVKGGVLAKPVPEVEKLFKACHPDMSCASWAIRFAASLDGVLAVLSGMSNVEQMKDNISYMKEFQPLNEEEQEIIRKAQVILGKSAAIPCTACRYCTEGCPKQIPIPDIFAAMNRQLGNGRLKEAKESYEACVSEGHCAGDCITCRKCEGACPQHLPISDHLKKAAEMFGH